MQSNYMLAWRSLHENRMRSLLSVIAVMLGVAVSIAGSMVAESVREGILKSDELRVIMEGLIDMLDPAMLFIGVMVQLAGGFLIFNTFGMAITRRRQQIGSLRALGMTRGQVLRVILAEALLLAVIGVVLGVLVSPLLGQVTIAFIKQVAGQMIAFGDATPALPVVIFGAIMGLLVTLLSVVLPARRAARVAPLDALHQPDAAGVEQASRWQTVLGAILAAGLLVYVVVAPPGEWVRYPIDILLTIALILVWLVAVVLMLPEMIGLAAHAGRRLFPGAVGRLVSDNLQRARARVTLTTATLAFALLVLIGLTGFLEFFLNHAIATTLEPERERDALFVGRVDVAGGWGVTMARGLDSILLADAEVQAILDTAEGRAYAIPNYFVVVPEISFMGSAYFSYMADPALLRRAETMFTFTEGSWDTALPIMEAGCGVLVAPTVAARHNAGIGDTITITGLDGPIDCTIAGLGASVAGASVISDTVREQVTDMNPVLVLVVPFAGTDLAALEADLRALNTQFPELTLTLISGFMVALDESIAVINVSLNAMLLLATFAAAFGVVNTMMMSVDERRRELVLLRAVGTTRAQTQRIIIGEAAFMGIVGGGVGLLAGLGAVLIIVLSYGLNGFGVSLDLRETALASATPALITGLVGLAAAPLIAAAAAWFPARGLLRETTAALVPPAQ